MLAENLLQTVTSVRLPRRTAISTRVDGLKIIRFGTPGRDVVAHVERFRCRGDPCRRVLATQDDGTAVVIEFAPYANDYDGVDAVLRATGPTVDNGLLRFDSAEFRDRPGGMPEARTAYQDTCDAWQEGIRYRSELRDQHDVVVRTGLREPQVGALHAVASHWTLADDPALVVMPTGTGKTEVMMAAAVGASASRVLVVVPTDALRQQTADKFAVYGVLRQIGVLGDIPYPVIGILASRPRASQFEAIEACNVVVATMAAIGQAQDEVAARFAALFSHVLFDEAHHIKAATWSRFQEHCTHAPSLMLTATPFREDGKQIEGRVIYNYPLSAAQQLGYFEPISFIEVFQPDAARADDEIAAAAVQKLREDLDAGHDHMLMARAQTIALATELFNNVYAPRYPDLNPVLIHSQTPGRRSVLDAIRAKRHRIVVCVDMFGEGFDLPNLKVAALHSIHKSLGITLQFIGRFARTGGDVGPATFVANTAEDGVPESLEGLYFDDPDWNLILQDLSYDAIDPQVRLSQLAENLRPVGEELGEVEISTFALRPKCSAMVYRTGAFHPRRFAKAFRRAQRIHQPQYSRDDKLLVLIVNQQDHLDWTDSRDIVVDTWDLYIAYYDEARELLFVHSSRKGDGTTGLARAVSENPALIRDEEVFKVFGGLRRLTLHSVGLSSRSRNVRYQMFAGLDVRNAFDPVQQQSKLKSVVTGVGYEEGERRSVGCSRKGKVWSMQSGSLAEWRSWCDAIGAKISNAGLDPDDFLKYTLVPTSVNELPECVALMADWPDQLFESTNFRFEVVRPGESYGFHDCQVDLIAWTPGGRAFDFRLQAGEEYETVLRLTLREEHNDNTYSVARLSGDELQVEFAGRVLTAAAFFEENPPLVRLENGAQLAGNILLTPREAIGDAFDRDRLDVMDWAGIDLTKESRWKDGAVRNDSVQERMVRHLEQTEATFIIDDDDTGESADLVAIEEEADRVVVWLWHCKYSSGAEPGHRMADLYEVCGQAEKSVKWTWNLRTLISHLTTREAKHRRGRPTRFLRGSLAGLATLRKSARRKFVSYRVGIVQPGVSAAQVTPEQLAVLGSTNSFVHTVTDSPLSVITSA